jgi:hypothetical protein
MTALPTSTAELPLLALRKQSCVALHDAAELPCDTARDTDAADELRHGRRRLMFVAES